jgi:predicted component of type VI protein secretion system
MADFFSIPVDFEKFRYNRLRKVGLYDSVQQNISLMLDTPLLRSYFAPKFGTSIVGLQYLHPAAFDDEQDWLLQLRKQVEQSIRASLEENEPRLSVRKVKVEMTSPEVNKLSTETKGVKYKQLVKIRISGVLNDGSRFQFETEKKLK